MIPRRVHLIGIGGIGLSAIARVLMGWGHQISGSDAVASPITDELVSLGARITIGHRAENLGDAELVLVTSAAAADNPEVVQARRRGIRIVKRYDFFPELTAGKKTIAVAGTHGKTTTTGMLAAILQDAGLDPTVVVGGIIPELGGNARAGSGAHVVIEADEYDRAFLGLRPEIAVVTSIEMDHPDIYRDVDHVASAFREFMALVPPGGLIAGCGDADRVTRELDHLRGVTVQRYGLGATNDWRASDLRPNSKGGSDFGVWRGDAREGEFSLRIPGEHNVTNALAAIAIADHLEIDLELARNTLAHFRGAARRFEVKGESRGVIVVDDYAHHPSEIRATLAAARQRYTGRPVWAVFQPHTYSRTLALLDEFAKAFVDADHVIIANIFASRERENPGISSLDLVKRIKHRDARYLESLDEIASFLEANLTSGDVVITLGAGDIHRVGTQVLQTLVGPMGNTEEDR